MSRPTPADLAVNGAARPTLPTDASPRFGWRIPDQEWGKKQEAYRVRVARARDGFEAPLWDSGRVESPTSTDVPYDGPPLAPDERYWWRVTVWNDRGERSAPSDPVPFRTAPDAPWDAEWVGPGGDANGFRTPFYDPADGPAWVGVDLGEARSLAGVELHPAEPFDGPTTPDGAVVTARDTEESYNEMTVAQGPVAFGFPEGYRIEVGGRPDFADAEPVVERPDADDPRREAVTHDLDTTARFLRVVATEPETVGGDPDPRLDVERDAWAVFALAALAVRDDAGNDLARGRPVHASASVDSGAWGADELTNGVFESRMGEGSPRLRREFSLSKPVKSARVHVAALGYGELYANGECVGDSVLDPGWTDYDERVLFRTYDLTDHLSAGENALGLWLGRGWFGKSARQWSAFGSPRALLRLTVEYEDGTVRTVTTGDEWAVGPSPVVENDIYDGERYDARRERDGWAAPAFNGEWDAAAVLPGPDGELTPQRTPPIRVTESLDPVAVHNHPEGPILDFGQNLAGWVEISLTGADAGDEVTLRHAEALTDDGDLATEDLRSAEATDTYVARGEEVERYEPRFTYHGFRYAQVSGYPGDLDASDATAKAVHTDLDSAGSFACSNPQLNRVQSNARWGLRSNAHSVPTDCPQRDERQGFTGDAHLASGALSYNFDAGRFHGKFARDHADAQSRQGYLPSTVPNGAQPDLTDPTWTYSALDLPWRTYCHRGSARQLREGYEHLRRYVDFWDETLEDGLIPDRYAEYGDWVALENLDGRRGKPLFFFSNAYHYRSTALLADIADALGLAGDAERYRERAHEVKDALNVRYFDGESYGETQAVNAVALSLGLVPDGKEEDVADTLVGLVEDADGHLRTGFLGTPALLDALPAYGHADVAYEVASAEGYPGWVYMIEQGATTVWERWNTDTINAQMNSRNHSPFALVSAFFYETLAGVSVSEALPEERRVDVTPGQVAALDWAEATIETPHGPLETGWERADGLSVSLSVPWNLRATVHLPAGEVRVNGDPVADAAGARRVSGTGEEGGDENGGGDGNSQTVEVTAGEHAIRVTEPDD